MSGMRGNPHERNAEESFRNDFRNLQRVKLLPFLLRQNTLHCLAQSSRLVATQDSGSHFTGQVEEVPIRTLDVSGQRRAIEILDDSPASQERFTFDRQIRRQRRVFSNQSRPCSISVWHFSVSHVTFRVAVRKAFCRSRNLRAASEVRLQLLRLALCKSFLDSQKSLRSA